MCDKDILRLNYKIRIIRLANSLKCRIFALNVRGVAQPGRAPRSGRGGRRFKSSHPDRHKGDARTSPFFICSAQWKPILMLLLFRLIHAI